jgi:hypothetical protein
MYRISIPALVIAFFAEFVADLVIQHTMMLIIGGSALNGDLTPDEFRKAAEIVIATPAFVIGGIIFGTATTFGGGYLAARIARSFPYYHGLAMGLMGIAYILYFWQAGAVWLNLLGVVTNIPVSIWGAHLAKRHMPAPE